MAIAGVIAMEPKVLILDEPTAGLDPAGAASPSWATSEDYHQANHATIVLVSHSMEEVARTGGPPGGGERRDAALHRARPGEVFSHGDELEAHGAGRARQ